LPFAKECMKDRPYIIIQEDKAPSHVYRGQNLVYNIQRISRLLWPGNSPNLNMIEPSWMHLKRITTQKGAPQSRNVAERRWQEAWNELEQWRIRRWIQRIIRHIKEISRLEP
jgi:hypothetical protein